MYLMTFKEYREGQLADFLFPTACGVFKLAYKCKKVEKMVKKRGFGVVFKRFFGNALIGNQLKGSR